MTFWCHLDAIRELKTFSKCRIGLNLSKTFCITFAYFTYTNHQLQKLFGQFISKHFDLENDIKMTPKRHSFLPALFFTCFCINQYYIFKQIWTKRTTRKLDSSHSGIQIQVRNQFIYQSSSPLDNKILYLNLSMWNNSLGHMTVPTGYLHYFSLSLLLLYHESWNLFTWKKTAITYL